MAETEKVPVKIEPKSTPVAPAPAATSPFDHLRREIEHVFDTFRAGTLGFPFLRGALAMSPAVDVAEKEGEYEITAELPGLDEKDIEVKLSNGNLTIKGEKKEEKEEKEKDYYLSERRYGAFTRVFQLPEGVDAQKVEARFAKGVLTVKLPKTEEACKQEKKIDIKAA